MLLSAHTPGYTPIVIGNVLGQIMGEGRFENGEMLLSGSENTLPLPSGVYSRWIAE